MKVIVLGKVVRLFENRRKEKRKMKVEEHWKKRKMSKMDIPAEQNTQYVFISDINYKKSPKLNKGIILIKEMELTKKSKVKATCLKKCGNAGNN